MIYILLFSLLLILFFPYLLQNRDIMAPSVLLTIGYLISCLCCIWNIEKWGVNLHQNTIVIILIGVICFVLGDLIALAVSPKQKFSIQVDNHPETISVSNITIYLFSVFNCLSLILSIIDMLRITGGWLQTLGNTIGMYRVAYSYTDEMVNPWVVQLLKVSKASSYVFLYIFINNVFVNKTEKKAVDKKDYLLLLPIILYLIVTLFRGGRSNLIVMAVAALFILYFLWHRKVGWNKTISVKFIKRIVLFFVAFVGVFFLTRTLVGRQSKLAFFDYITSYFGGSIELFDDYLNSSKVTTGNETFPGILQSLYKLGLTKELIHKSLEFRYSSTGIEVGNIYTGLRRFFNDFGYCGVVVMQLVYGLIFGLMYTKIKSIKTLNSKKLFIVLFYATILHSPLIQATEDTFWINLSVGYIIEVIILYVCVVLIMDFHWGKKGKIIHKRWYN